MTHEYEVNSIRSITIGYVGENNVLDITFDYSDWLSEYGSGVLTLTFIRPSETEPYPIALNMQTAGKATWTVDLTDTERKGRGEAQLVYVVDNRVKKNLVFPVFVRRSLEGSKNPVDPWLRYLETMISLGSETQDAALSASASASAAAQSALDAGSAKDSATASANDAEQYARAAAASAADAWAAAGGYMAVEVRDEHLIIVITNCNQLTFRAVDERLVVTYG